MSKSEDGLKAAFAGESQANRKYLAFAQAADKEGYAQAAKLFRAAAEAETVHAFNHLKALKAVRSTGENLQEAIDGEIHEYTKMYPAMIGDAKSEGNQEALKTFQWANAVEEVHAGLYKGLLNSLGKSEDTYPYYVCPVCGYTHEKEAPETCPVCGTRGKFFKRMD